MKTSSAESTLGRNMAITTRVAASPIAAPINLFIAERVLTWTARLTARPDMADSPPALKVCPQGKSESFNVLEGIYITKINNCQ